MLFRSTRLVSDLDEQDILSSQIESYKKSLGDFGMPMAIRQREKLSPGMLYVSIHIYIYTFHLKVCYLLCTKLIISFIFGSCLVGAIWK